jgi:hypothetical protein
MHWYQDEEEEEADLMFSPALLARRASESWIDSAPIEVSLLSANFQNFKISILTKLFSPLFVEYSHQRDTST